MGSLAALMMMCTVVQGGSLPVDDATARPAEVVAPEPPKHEKTFDAIGIPLLSFNSDTGVGIGAAGGAYFYSPGYRPYRHALALNFFFTTHGIQNHYLRYDGPRLFGNNRLEARIEHRRETLSPYYGDGNIVSPEWNGDTTNKRYNYDILAPGGWVRLRGEPFGPGHPFQPYFGYGYHYNRIRAYEGSVLAEHKPVGFEGGSSGQVAGGILWDTRDDENDPTRGAAEEVAIRAAHRVTLSDWNFWGLTLAEKRFIRLGTPRLIFAERLTFDALWGDVPFFELDNFGGLAGPEGIGGMSSVRGIARNRYAGKVKAFSNSELRFYAFDFQFRGETVHAGGLAFVDFGRTWQPSVEDGEWYSWHSGVGGGLRVSRKAAVLRLDYAYAPEIGRQAVYVGFGHMF